jgi:hypothetical protein
MQYSFKQGSLFLPFFALCQAPESRSLALPGSLLHSFTDSDFTDFRPAPPHTRLCIPHPSAATPQFALITPH